MPGCPPKVKSGPDLLIVNTLASRRERAVQQRGQHHHHQHRPEVRAGTERGRCHCHAMFTAVNIGDLYPGGVPLHGGAGGDGAGPLQLARGLQGGRGSGRGGALTLIFADGEEAVLRQRQPVLRRPQCWRHVSGEGATGHGHGRIN